MENKGSVRVVGGKITLVEGVERLRSCVSIGQLLLLASRSEGTLATQLFNVLQI
jgi:hypothetical protein